MHSQVVVQTIRTTWGRAGRHADTARQRASLPRVLPLPTLPEGAERAALVWHRVDTGFAPARQSVVVGTSAERDFEQASLEWRDDRLAAWLDAEMRFTLKAGQHGMLEYNHFENAYEMGIRTAIFSHVVLHVAVGVAWRTDLFHTQPTRIARALRDWRSAR